MANRLNFEPSWMDWLSDPRLQGVASPSAANLASQYLLQVGKGLAEFPRMAFEEANKATRGEDFDPGVTMGAAALPFGGTAFSAPRGALGAGPAIKAYHGSPHSFERFDLTKLGTGEGGQAYGHGLYFAENPAVAESYKTAGGRSNLWTVNGRPVSTSGVGSFSNVATPELGAAYLMDMQRGDKAAALRTTESMLKHTSDPKFVEEVRDILKTGEIKRHKGHMYEVEIKADPNTLLKYDRPLAENPPEVRKLAKEFGVPEILDVPETRSSWTPGPRPLTGQSLYGQLTYEFGGPDKASRVLERKGIPGLTYLDRGSRAAGEGTSNYVTFRDDIINILRKYGLAGLAPLGGLEALKSGAYQGKGGE